MASKLKIRRSAGFTLLEMMIVISIILILMSIALPIYNQSVLRVARGGVASGLVRTALADFAVHAG